MDSNKSNALREIKVALIKIEHSTDNDEIYDLLERIQDEAQEYKTSLGE
ncbi:hypothetical protein [Niallia circulans]|nr:hypothetical protein [Niallia circulans]